ncbi:unnamed protein product [Boreogadus saida]
MRQKDVKRTKSREEVPRVTSVSGWAVFWPGVGRPQEDVPEKRRPLLRSTPHRCPHTGGVSETRSEGPPLRNESRTSALGAAGGRRRTRDRITIIRTEEMKKERPLNHPVTTDSVKVCDTSARAAWCRSDDIIVRECDGGDSPVVVYRVYMGPKTDGPCGRFVAPGSELVRREERRRRRKTIRSSPEARLDRAALLCSSCPEQQTGARLRHTASPEREEINT